jgi:NADPH:quinone reductase-like Zn-dependent oxidoreductase
VQAVWYERYGAPSVLNHGEQAMAVPGAGQLRIRLLASALAQVDVKLRAGLLQAHIPLRFPKVPGRDGVGVVDAVGPGVTGWQVGDEACVLAAPSGAGTAASHIVCDAARVVRRPSGLDLFQCAALLQPGVSAWAAIAAAELQPGMRVLVHGGSGSVGALLLQHLRAVGVHAIATCRHAHRKHTLAQGASEVVAYDREGFDHLRGLDVVFDLVGGDTHARSYPLLRPGGTLVYLVAAPFVDHSAAWGVGLRRAMVTDAPEAMARVAERAQAGIFLPLVSQTLPLRDAAAAHAAMENGEVHLGRIVFAH